MNIEIPENLETALKTKANALGTSTAVFVRKVLERELELPAEATVPVVPYKNSRGMLTKYGPAPTAEEIDQNRREMFKNTIFARDAQ
jgi:hypothetical protein